ncbi:MAG: hypothetical protein U0670_03870 [Anaerolineae bacterium]
MRTVLRVSFLAALLALLFAVFAVQAAPGEQYRRWLNNKSMSCSTGSGVVYANLSNQDVEFNNLPADAQFTINYVDNGLNTPSGPYTVEQTSGTKAYGSFAESFPSYPFTFEFRLDTLIDGIVVYQSSIFINCSGDMASTPATVVNTVPANAQARVWTNDKTFTCGPNGGGVAVTLNNQNIDVLNLTAGVDQFTLHYIDNGMDTVDGPYPVESNGRHNYGSFLEPFASYPFTFEFRIDTIVGGVVVYQSSLIATCTADGGPYPLVPVSGPPGSVGGTDYVGCVTGVPAGSRLGTILNTTNGLWGPDAGDVTNVVLPAGSRWFVIGTQGDFVRLWIACLANPVWVDAENIDLP